MTQRAGTEKGMIRMGPLTGTDGWMKKRSLAPRRRDKNSLSQSTQGTQRRLRKYKIRINGWKKKGLAQRRQGAEKEEIGVWELEKGMTA
jgi:hypothetical protein